ncbi:MAG: antitoxin family protein [Planctomycetes bacterium]|nr:antitoxin family protein [Planctomycetota bacterium]
MQVIHATYENGVFRPSQPVNLPERSEVEIIIQKVSDNGSKPSLKELYRILSESVDTGDPSLASRHDEYQP